MKTADFNLKEMQVHIEKIIQHARELSALGAGIPVVEKNTRMLLSVTENLKFGIVDPAMLVDK